MLVCSLRKLPGRLSAEWLLTYFPNGGNIILFRSLWTSVIIYSSTIGLRNALDPERTWAFSCYELKVQLIQTIPWLAAIFAAIYAALYARFSSQWSYLAGVYNQNKATESGGGADKEKLAEWKAGFFEDAEVLHLATKPLFASVLRAWGKDKHVKKAFCESTDGGEKRFDRLMKRVKAAYEQQQA